MTDGGRSFKGAALYYLHDKREADEAERLTAERVAWTEAVNLPTGDPERAWRMMAHTAMAQAELKAAAGGKATGRKLTKPLLAYSLSWHPTEKPSRAEQVAAARASLKELGVEGHQALIVCHTDEPHAHVHILLNRVDPTTGIAAKLDNSKLKLSKWAQQYEQTRGVIFCPARVENNARREQGEKVHAPRKSRATFEAATTTANDSLTADFVRTEQRQKDAQLYAERRTMDKSHERHRESLKAVYDASRGKLTAYDDQLRKTKTVEVKDAMRAEWRDLLRAQADERATFEAAERGTLSRLWSMAVLWRELRQRDPDRKALAIFYTLLSSAQRRAVFDAAQERQRRSMAVRVRDAVKTAHRAVAAQTAADKVRLRAQYLTKCAELRADQGQRRADHAKAWTVRNAERNAALGPFRAKQAQAAKAPPRRPAQEQTTAIKPRGMDYKPF